MVDRNGQAYDFQRFEDNYQRKVEQKPKTKVKIQARKTNEQAVNKKRYVKFLMVVVYALLLSSALLYANVTLTEISNELTNQQEIFGVLESDSAALTLSVESMVSLQDIETQAMGYGMIEPSTTQTQYVQLTSENKAEVLDYKESIFSKVMGIYDGVKEYILNS